MKFSLSFKYFYLYILLFGFILSNPGVVQSASEVPDKVSTQNSPSKISIDTHEVLLSNINQHGSARVIIGLASTLEPEAAMTGKQASTTLLKGKRRAAIARLQHQVLKSLRKNNINKIKQFKDIPYIAMELDDISITHLQQLTEVISIHEDKLDAPILDVSSPLIGATAAWSAGYSGTGQAVAVLDTGVDKTHSFLSGKVVSEACFSSTYSISVTACPDGAEQQIGNGAGVNCSTSVSGCKHGTHVAGIAAGDGTSFSGVAKDASIIAVQVFSIFNLSTYCGSSTPCVLSYTSDQILALEYIYSLSSSYDIASVNMSLGGGRYYDQASCDSDNASRKAAIDNLRSVNIATVISSGNSGYTDSLGSPGCISSAVSVGASNDYDNVAYFSNSAYFLDVLAPGVSINSSVPYGGYESWNGTSMAAPQTAGAWALLKSAKTDATVDEILNALKNTGVPISDYRTGEVFPRIQVNDAVNVLTGNIPNIITSADSTEDVFLNGVYLGSSRDWEKSSAYLTAIQDGYNVLAVKAVGSQGTDSGFISELDWEGLSVVTDNSWKVSTTWESGWQQVVYDDTSWATATSYGSYGISPWLKDVVGFPYSSTAEWIWSDDNINNDVVYFRYGFTLVSIPLEVKSITIENALVGEEFQQTLTAIGGQPPYYWTEVAGSLPNGLSLDSATGIIDGIPTADGSYDFTVQVQDYNSDTAIQVLSLTVDSAPLNLTISTDNINEVYLNGVLVGSSKNWRLAKNYQVPLQSGVNIIAVKANDTVSDEAGLIAELTWGSNIAVSDNSWKVSTVLQAGWEEVAFDDSAWPAASSYGSYGVEPWLQKVRRFPEDSLAEWIWSADNVADDEVYFRYAIVLP